MIKLVNIRKEYNKRVIINNLNITFNNNGFYLIQGLNGSGKSTLLNIISNSIDYSGDVIFSDDICHNDLYYQRCEDNTFNNISVYNKAKLYLSDDQYYIFYEYIKKYELEYIINSKIKELSSGEKQKIELLLALSKKAKITMLDEPLEHIDIESKNLLFKELEELSKTSLVIITSPKTNNIKGNVIYSNVFNIIELHSNNNISDNNKHKTNFTFKDYFLVYFSKSKIKILLMILILCLYSIIITLSLFIKPYVYNNTINSTFNAMPISVCYNANENNVYQLNENNYDISNLKIGSNNKNFIRIKELYGTDKVYFYGKETIINDNEIYISDYVFNILDTDLSKLMVMGNTRGNDYKVKVYKTDYRDYLPVADPNEDKELYLEQFDIFSKRCEKYYNLMFVNNNTLLGTIDSFKKMEQDKIVNLINMDHDPSLGNVVDSFMYYLEPKVPIALLLKDDKNGKYVSNENKTFYCNVYDQFINYFDNCTPQEFLTLLDDDITNDYKKEFTLKIGNTTIDNMVFTNNATPIISNMLFLDYNSALKVYNENNIISGMSYYNVPKTCKMLDNNLTLEELNNVEFIIKDKFDVMLINQKTLDNTLFISSLTIILFIVTLVVFNIIQYKKERLLINTLYIKGFSKTKAFIVNYAISIIVSLLIILISSVTAYYLMHFISVMLGLLL